MLPPNVTVEMVQPPQQKTDPTSQSLPMGKLDIEIKHKDEQSTIIKILNHPVVATTFITAILGALLYLQASLRTPDDYDQFEYLDDDDEEGDL